MQKAYQLVKYFFDKPKREQQQKRFSCNHKNSI